MKFLYKNILMLFFVIFCNLVIEVNAAALEFSDKCSQVLKRGRRLLDLLEKSSGYDKTSKSLNMQMRTLGSILLKNSKKNYTIQEEDMQRLDRFSQDLSYAEGMYNSNNKQKSSVSSKEPLKNKINNENVKDERLNALTKQSQALAVRCEKVLNVLQNTSGYQKTIIELMQGLKNIKNFLSGGRQASFSIDAYKQRLGHLEDSLQYIEQHYIPNISQKKNNRKNLVQ